MGEIGAALREARERKNISLVEAEEATKIKRRYLEALEIENFQELPGQVYAVGFLKNYARFLGLEEEEVNKLTEALKAGMGVPVPSGREVNGRKRSKRPGRSLFQLPKSRILKAGIFILAVLVLAKVAYSGLGSKEELNQPLSIPSDFFETVSPDEPANSSGESKEITEEDLSVSSPTLPSSDIVEPFSINLELFVRKDRCWMQIIVDGKEAFNGTLREGDSRKFSANQKIFVHLGNAGCVEIVQNGESLGYLGEWGSVVKKEFVSESSLEGL